MSTTITDRSSRDLCLAATDLLQNADRSTLPDPICVSLYAPVACIGVQLQNLADLTEWANWFGRPVEDEAMSRGRTHYAVEARWLGNDVHLWVITATEPPVAVAS